MHQYFTGLLPLAKKTFIYPLLPEGVFLSLEGSFYLRLLILKSKHKNKARSSDLIFFLVYYQTLTKISPPRRALRASSPVIIPLEVETRITPRPDLTFGRSSAEV